MNTAKQYLLASIVESSQDSIVTIDLNRIITSWNKGAEDLYGYSAGEVIGKPLSMVMLPTDIQDLIDKVDKIVQELVVPIYETVRVHKNGKQADLEILLSPVRNLQGEVIGISTLARDISLRKMQEKQKDDFIAVASHELKTPVTSIKAYTQLLQEQLKSSGEEIAVSMVEKLDAQIDRLIGLIGTLLDTTKLAAGEILLHKEVFDLNQLIKEQIDTFTIISVKHHFNFNAGDIKPVYADKKLIGRVITNIISNAYKYAPDRSEIIVSSTETENGVEVSIRDFGVGIPDELQSRIFDRYFRIANPATAKASGIGLGLYITAEIVRQHGGQMRVTSKEGSGATFYFTLPYGK